jgi:hypothetical protein
MADAEDRQGGSEIEHRPSAGEGCEWRWRKRDRTRHQTTVAKQLASQIRMG